ncbi:uncharacterized protein [Dysidea avara]|uniref:uncharacterized protein n=1 Tax=Dysidea avara TaxID=196820 RepID=UPI00333136BF
MVGRLILFLSLPSALLALVPALTPPMGWNTWCTDGSCGRDYCDAKEIMSIADAMETNGMKDAGYEYINLDDCWADHRDQNGTIVPDMNRFPSGLMPVINYVHSKGFKFGLYTDGGIHTCSSGERPYKIPGSYGHYEQDAFTYAKWGVDYVKMDWCNTEFNGTKLDPHKQYAEMSAALDNTTKEFFFNSCEWGVDNPWEWMWQYANSWRSGPDHHDSWDSTERIIEHNVGLGKYAGPTKGWNDLDFIMTGGQGCKDDHSKICPGQTDVEYRSEFSMWVIMASPLLVVTDIRNMTELQKEILLNAEMISVHQDKLGKAGDRVGGWDCSEGKERCQIWAKPLNDGSVAVALFNSGKEAHDITLDFKVIGMEDAVMMRDLWQHKDLGKFENSFTINVASHGAEVYKITKA